MRNRNASFLYCLWGKNGNEKPIINSSIATQSDTTTNSESTNSEADFYSNKTYNIGADIPEGEYVISCTNTNYSMDVVIFSSDNEYTEFQKAKKFTNGEYNAAVENYAWADFNLTKDDKAYIKLNNGNIILLDDGKCEFTKYNLSATDKLYSGLYVIGEDLSSGNIDIKCTTSIMQIVIFENKDKYLEYHKTKRYTVGEESRAIEEHALSSDYIHSGDTTSLNLKKDMILLIKKGFGEYSVDNGPIIN